MKNSLRHLLILLLALPLPAPAACALCTCTVSATGISFGTYNPLSGSNRDDTGNVRINCNGGVGTVTYTIRINRTSTGFSRMASGNHRISYELYTDPAHTIVWGDGNSGTGVFSGTLDVSRTGSSRDHVVYGRLPGRQASAAVGGYSDTITFTLIYQ